MSFLSQSGNLEHGVRWIVDSDSLMPRITASWSPLQRNIFQKRIDFRIGVNIYVIAKNEIIQI